MAGINRDRMIPTPPSTASAVEAAPTAQAEAGCRCVYSFHQSLVFANIPRLS
jgi:hypothetical protein